jgi:uncharacterized protein (DUF2236 family)
MPDDGPVEEDVLRRLTGLGVFLGGPANVVMQLGWPEVGYGVVESQVRSGSVHHHPFKRFRTTVAYLGIALWGSDELRAAYREAIDGQHRQVRSRPGSPVSYNAFSPDLQLWVASCLHHGLRDLVTRMDGPLTDAEEEALLRIGGRFGTTLQVPPERWHPDRAAFDAYWQEGLQRVRFDEPVRRYVVGVLRQEMLPLGLARVAGPVMAWLNTGFLPARFRDELDLSWSARDERRHARVVRLVGRLQGCLPMRLRRFPVNLMVADVALRRRLGRPLV